MTPALERFIELATRPLARRTEAREEARGELMGRLGHQGVPVEMIDVAEPTARLEAAKARSPWWRRGLVLGALLLAIGGFLFGLYRDAAAVVRLSLVQQLQWSQVPEDAGGRLWWDRFLFDWVDRRAPDLPLSGRPGELEALRERHPEDLAILQESLARRSIEEDAFMTEEERALVERLDPDNALWPLMEMRWEFRKAGGGMAYGFGRFGGSSASPDPDAEERAWARFAEAADQSRYESYGLELLRRQLEAFPSESTVMGAFVRWGFAGQAETSGEVGAYRFRAGPWGGAETIRERASSLVSKKDEEGLRSLFAAWQRLCELFLSAEAADAPVDMPDDFREVAANFESAFRRLGLAEDGEAAARLAEKLNGLPGGFMSYGTLDGEAGLRAAAVGNADLENVPRKRLEPGRKADMSFFHRLFVWPAVAVVVLLVLMCGFEACRRAFTVKGMARGLMPLLTWRDHAWMGGLGVAAPWVYWWVLTRWTPLGVSDRVFVDDGWRAAVWVLQVPLGLVLGLVLLVQTAHWRWEKRAGFLGFRSGVPWLGWVVAALVALAIPVAGMLESLPLPDDDAKGFFLVGCAGMGAVGLLWLLWVGGMNLFTPRQSALRANLVSRTLIPWSLAGVATLLLAAGVLRFAESWWYRRDPLLPTWTSGEFAHALQERAAVERHEALREAFGVE